MFGPVDQREGTERVYVANLREFLSKQSIERKFIRSRPLRAQVQSISSERDTPAQGASPRHFGSAARKPESPRARERYAALTRAESLQTRCALSPRLAACAT